MDKITIEKEVINILANMSGTESSQITKQSKLEDLIRTSSKDILAARIDNKFPPVNATILHNALFGTIKTVGDIVNFITEYYD